MIEIKSIQQMLYKEGSLTVVDIVKSMLKPVAPFNKPRYASGRTATSLRVEAEPELLSIYAPDYFDQLETGISPAQSQKKNVSKLARNLYGWTFNAEIDFENKKDRFKFSFNSAKKQQSVGSVLYRRCGQRDIYSDKVQPLVTKITEKVASEFINVKLLSK